jgi:uncharacterized protein YecA (UPF0149 family)
MLTATQIVEHLKAGTVVALTKASADLFIKWLNANKIEMVFQMEVNGDKARLIPIKEKEKQIPFKIIYPKPKRNNTCPCGSGKKYKKCCLNGKRQ